MSLTLCSFNVTMSSYRQCAGKAVTEWTSRLSPGIADLVKKLKGNNVDVYLVFGGFRQMINPVASILEIPRENIFANQLLFGKSGEFLGFDVNEPTSKSGGKPVAVHQIRKAHGYKTLAMIGDGATDLEVRKWFTNTCSPLVPYCSLRSEVSLYHILVELGTTFSVIIENKSLGGLACLLYMDVKTMI